MKKWKRGLKKGLAYLLIFSMILSMSGIPTLTVNASEGITVSDSCEHHTEHNEDCGYIEATEGSPCTHEHDDSCYAEEAGGETKTLNCQHTHDENCGYVEAVEGHPCAFACTDCVYEPKEEENVCTCEVQCGEDSVNSECPVCSVEGTDLSACAGEEGDACTCGTDDETIHATNCPAYVAPENPECFCAEKCTEETANVWCDVCGFDYTDCKGEESAALYADGCVHEAGETTTIENGRCTVCNIYGWCGKPETEGGTITNTLTWTFTGDETNGYALTISGEGEMADMNYTSWAWGPYAEKIKSIEINEGVKSIGAWAFSDTPITSITIPTSVTTIGQRAFTYCPSLTEILVDEGSNAYKSEDGVLISADGTLIAYPLAKEGTSYTIPNGVKSIGAQAFRENTTLESVIIPDGVKSIGEYAFGKCTSLTSVTFPLNLDTIGNRAFWYCEALESITIPDGPTTIGNYAFAYCESLTSVTFPASVTSLGERIFDDASNLYEITFLGKTSPSDSNVFRYSSVAKVIVSDDYESDNFCGVSVVNGHFDAETGESNLTHSVAGNAIIVKCKGCEYEATATLKILEPGDGEAEGEYIYDGRNKAYIEYSDNWVGGNVETIPADTSAVNEKGYNITQLNSEKFGVITLEEGYFFKVNEGSYDLIFNVSQGNIVIGADTISYGNNRTIPHESGMEIVIMGTTTSNTVTVKSGVSANITFAGVDIDVSGISGAAALKIEDGSTGNVTITLADGTTNTLKSGSNCAGLQKNGSGENIGKLIIQSGELGTGVLTVTGGSNGAGIGGGKNAATANIIITGGSVKASSIGCTPTDGNGNNAYLFTIANPNNETITINGKGYPSQHSADDTNVYAYLPEGIVHEVTVGGVVTKYAYDTTLRKFVEALECPYEIEGGVNGIDYRYNGTSTLTVLTATPITIRNKDNTTPTQVAIVVAKDVPANVTLDGVNIDTSTIDGLAAFKIADNSTGNVTITIADGTTNTLKSAINAAGIQKNGNGENIGKLTIQGGELDTGILNVTGGNNGAGIGGGSSGYGSNITISGGTITATGGIKGAGIGGGSYRDGTNITISGGTVSATSVNTPGGGEDGGAGIGGGHQGAGSNINISGGTVTTKGGYGGAGIGGAKYEDGSNITISGGTVFATGGWDSAGIGGGEWGDGINIIISDGTVKSQGGGYGAAIGGSYFGKGDNITISGGNVIASAGYNGAGIGGGGNGEGTNITISGGTVTATGGGSNMDDVAGGAAIGSGDNNSSSHTIIISGGSVKTITSGDGGNTIGGSAGNPAVTPTDGTNDVYLLKIANPDNKTVIINNKEYPSQHSADDTYVYAYLPAKSAENPNIVALGDEWIKYYYDIDKQEWVELEDKYTILVPDNTDFTYNGKEQTYGITETNYYTISGNKQTNAGTHIVTVTLNGTNAVKEYEFIIKPADLTITAKDQTITYGESISKGVNYISGTLVTGDKFSGITLSTEDVDVTTNGTITPSDVKIVNAGGEDVTANYNISYVEGNLTINPKEVKSPTIILTPDSYTYDRTAKEPTVTVKDGETVIPADEYTVTYSNNINVGNETTKPTVTITDNEGGNYDVSGVADFTINAVDISTLDEEAVEIGAISNQTYTRQPITPKPDINITYEGESLVENEDYTLSYEDNTNAGTASVIINGKGNFSGSIKVPFTIDKAPITIESVDVEDKTYDTNSDATVTAVTFDGFIENESLTLDDYEVSAEFESAGAGNNKKVTVTVTLDEDINYIFANGTRTDTAEARANISKKAATSPDTPTAINSIVYGNPLSSVELSETDWQWQWVDGDKIPTVTNSGYDVYVKVDDANYDYTDIEGYDSATHRVIRTIVVTVTKADVAPNPIEDSVTYKFDLGADDVMVDVAGLLPPDKGTTTYSFDRTDANSILDNVDVDANGNLTYSVKTLDTYADGITASISVTAQMANYKDVTYTLTINITDKYVLVEKAGAEVSADSTSLVYGQKVSTLSLNTNEAKFVITGTDTEVAGTLSWATPEAVLSAGKHAVTWKFVPNDEELYETLTGTITVTVSTAAPVISEAPTVASRVYHPNVALADSDLNGGKVTWTVGGVEETVEGTWSWQTAGTIPQTGEAKYVAVFNPTDATNYVSVTQQITVKVTKATPYIAENPTVSEITYGQTLAASTISGGKVQYSESDTTSVAGQFEWKDATIAPAYADSGKTNYVLVFKPTDSDNYNEVTTNVKITVNKAENAPNMPGTTMNVAYSNKTVGAVTLQEGWVWQESDKATVLEVGVPATATAVYNGADKGNYENETVVITITRSTCEHENTEVRGAKNASCTEEGYSGDTYCKDCGECIATGHTIEKKQHSGGTATCTHLAKCTACGTEYGSLNPNNHEGTKLVGKKDADCTSDGYTGDKRCIGCDALIEKGHTTAATGHDYSSEVTKEPTTTEEGERTYTCAKCNDTYTEAIPKLPEEEHKHSYTATITREATCSQTGIKTFTCSCGDSYTESISKLDHKYTSKVTVEPTTEKEGEMTYTCSLCGHSYTETIDKLTDGSSDKGDAPYIEGDGGKMGWDVISDEIDDAKDAKDGDTVVVDMNGSTTVPGDIIEQIKGKDITITFKLDNGLSWTVNGKTVTADEIGDIDFGVTIGSDEAPLNQIPVDVINNVTGERYSMELTLAYDGEFGFEAVLSVEMDAKNAGLYANLFYYNPNTNATEYICADVIDEKGITELTFTHASDYLIVIDDTDMGIEDTMADVEDSVTDGSDTTVTTEASKTEDNSWRIVWIIVIGAVVLVIGGITFFAVKRRRKEEE